MQVLTTTMRNSSLRLFTPEQVEAFDYCVSRHGKGIYIGLDVRLGKTAVVSRYVRRYIAPTPSRPTLIIAPGDVCINWMAELSMEGFTNVRLLSGLTKPKAVSLLQEGHSVYVCHKEGVIPLELYKKHWHCVIVDEAHILTSPSSEFSKHLHGKKSKKAIYQPPLPKQLEELKDKIAVTTRANSLVKLKREYDIIKEHIELGTKPKKKYQQIPPFPKVPHKIAMNGNPFSEGAQTIVNQVIWSHDVFMGCKDWWSFREKYMQQDFDGFNWILKRGVDTQIHQMAHRVCKIEVQTRGEKKKFEVVNVKMPLAVKKRYLEMKRYFEVDEVDTSYPMVKYGYMYRIANGHFLSDREDAEKHKWLGKHHKLVDMILENEGEQCIVWSKYTSDINQIENMLLTENVSCTVIDGRVPKEERANRIADFQEGRKQVAILQFKSNYRGLRFSAAKVAYVLNYEWSGDITYQAFARHIDTMVEGVKRIVSIVVPGTIDEDVHEVAQDKTARGRFFAKKLALRMMYE